ncbi:MAG: NAD(P)-binding domain-containing protein [Alphaproteobacteria bacterium]|nr:NAD(P)-binding domain-containing protein [Alphaproteobacteria bacterium]
MTLSSTCIIGAGPGGLAAARALKRYGVPYEQFERHSDVGGLWDAQNPGTPLYDSAHFISSKTQSAFTDCPMPDTYPDYPSGKEILDYVHHFADQYGLRDAIHFNTGVESASPDGKGGWSIKLTSGETKSFANLIVATGTNWHPNRPSYPGTFSGEAIHAVDYASPDRFRSKRVMVVGAGNSGCDIACDAAIHADKAFISVRRGYHFIPKHIFGMPADVFAHGGPKLPMPIQQWVMGKMLRLLIGDVTRYGLPQPDHKVFESHPIVNSELLHHLGHGNIHAKPDIERFDGSDVIFKDGSREELDVIVYATGYNYSMPYLAEGAVPFRAGRPDLYLTVFGRDLPGFYAMGFEETNSGGYFLYDEMANCIANAIQDRARAPARAEQFRQETTTDPDLSGGIRFIESPRHANYVDSPTFQAALKKLARRYNWAPVDEAAFTAMRTSAASAQTTRAA